MRNRKITVQEAAICKRQLMTAVINPSSRVDLLDEVIYEQYDRSYAVNNARLADCLRQLAYHFDNWEEMYEAEQSNLTNSTTSS